MYIYQKTNRYFAQVADDIKDIAEKEIISLGGKNTRQSYRGIFFTATQRTLYSINYHSRLISRVLAPLIYFNCHSDRYLYKQASRIEWKDFMTPANTFAIFATVSNSRIRHSRFAALRMKDAIADYFRSISGKRPSVNTRNPDIWFNLHIENNKATISLDTSGGSLHRRGYRKESTTAPMVETLAAAIIRHSEWKGNTPLYDPFCGSGTFLCEAFMHASHMPSGILRSNFGFKRLPDFDSTLWKKIIREGKQNIKPVLKGLISGSDISLEAVKTARQNCRMIDRENHISIKRQDIFGIETLRDKTIICNPPYGIRTGKAEEMPDFYSRFGDFLKRHCTGSTAYVYFGEPAFIKSMGLKPSWKKPLSNGGLDGRLVRYELY
ncbi:MAG TPA: THUMP domain-containing protein [Desulfobacteraceae bacterium]|nr:THUMP domain-containing protein [Desulfobacteraceae bacterium]HPJ66567.1 THUMP domain-containing protein [Desulfobacteraceae bacterium]HPQ27467.1 THUMP domain-containing protein [Desulfobacteraceae bacterium]